MAKFLVGVITGLILSVLLGISILFGLARMREKPPAVARDSMLVLQLRGDLPERPPVEYPFPILQDRNRLTVANVWMTLKKAAADSRIKAVVIEPSDLAIGWAKLEEIRADLALFRKSGKPLYAYLKTPGTREYFLGSAAERVYLAPEDMLDLKGMRVEMMYFKKAADKLGVQIEIEHAGKYKDFGEMFTRTEASPESREALNALLDSVYGNLIARLAESRRKTSAEMLAIIDQGPFLAPRAKERGLVDGLIYEDAMEGELKARLKVGEIKKITAQEYRRVPPASLGLKGNQRIALVVAEGSITRGEPSSDGYSSEGIESEGFNKILRRVGNDSRLRGVVLRIDSPGGEVFASDEIWREMNILSKKKPVVISMSDVAASGGYYMAMSGDPVIAYPGTITGSIGVVFGKANLRGLYDKLGITKDILSRGQYATIDTDYRALTEAERKKLKDGIDAHYHSFVQKVAQARKRKYEEIAPVAEGRVWTGTDAKARGLVDELGGLDRAIEIVKQRARIPASEHVELVTYPPRRTIFELIFGSGEEAAIPGVLRGFLRGFDLPLWAKGGYLRVMPFTLEFR
jgi:protease-4